VVGDSLLQGMGHLSADVAFVTGDLLIARCSDLGCCRDAAKVCLSFRLIPLDGHPHGWQWCCQGTVGLNEKVLQKSGGKSDFQR